MDEWFKFGVMRGIVGLVVAVLIGVAMSQLAMSYAYTPIAKEAISGLGVGTNKVVGSPAFILFAYLFGATIGVLLSGFTYWLSAKLCEEIGIRAKGIWAPIAVGLIGGFIVAIAIGSIITIFVSFVDPTLGYRVMIAIIASLPVSMILELGYIVVTYGMYKFVGWEVPEL